MSEVRSGRPRPASPSVDLSGLVPGASAAAAMPPSMGQREEPCACGGVLVASDCEVAEVVKQHVASLLHLEWRMRLGL